jgi:hypothetical protein
LAYGGARGIGVLSVLRQSCVNLTYTLRVPDFFFRENEKIEKSAFFLWFRIENFLCGLREAYLLLMVPRTPINNVISRNAWDMTWRLGSPERFTRCL